MFSKTLLISIFALGVAAGLSPLKAEPFRPRHDVRDRHDVHRVDNHIRRCCERGPLHPVRRPIGHRR